jgi:hypothetical protein
MSAQTHQSGESISGIEIDSKSDCRNARATLMLALGLFGIFAVAQIAGIEVVGGDPDRFFRPLKSELTRSLRAGKLPLWSDLFGFGMPLAAESEIGTFYPPHWLIYPALGPSVGYRVSNCMHQIMAICFTFLLSRRLGAMPLGAALGAMIFVLGGFPTIQASKEWAMLGMAWMPAAFLGMEIWLEEGPSKGGRRGLALLATALACLALIGHFQMAQLTSLGLAIWVLARTLPSRSLARRWPGLILAVVVATAIASPQLALSWEYAKSVGATNRSLGTLSHYSYPLECLTELVVPLWTRHVEGGPEGAFWILRNTTRYEAAMFAGTAGLILALIGLCTLDQWAKRSLPILGLIVAGFALSTMPRWSIEGYATVLELPGMGLFRCPGRYGVLAHLGLALAAARGWGRWPNVVSILAMMVTFIGSIWFLKEFLDTPLIAPGSGAKLPVVEIKTKLMGFVDPAAFGLALISFYGFAILIFLGLTRPKLRVLLFLLATAELSWFYFAGPTRWGWSLGLPESSPLLVNLMEESKKGPVTVLGAVDNIPVTLGVTTFKPYFGVAMPSANEQLLGRLDVTTLQFLDRRGQGDYSTESLTRTGVTHVVREFTPKDATPFPNDPLSLAMQGAGPKARTLYLARLDSSKYPVFPWCWAAKEFGLAGDSAHANFGRMFVSQAAIFDDPDDLQRFRSNLADLDTKAEVTFDETRESLKIKHSGSALIVMKRTFDKGWQAVDDATGDRYPIVSVSSGVQALVVPGSGNSGAAKETIVRLRYWPQSLNLTLPASLAGIVAVSMLFGGPQNLRLRKVKTAES